MLKSKKRKKPTLEPQQWACAIADHYNGNAPDEEVALLVEGWLAGYGVKFPFKLASGGKLYDAAFLMAVLYEGKLTAQEGALAIQGGWKLGLQHIKDGTIVLVEV